jgi:hypothetical protein
MTTSLGMAQAARQECFGDAFLLAVAGAAGCAASLRRPDDDSIDWTLSCRLTRRPKLDVQMKTWTGDNGSSDPIRYALKRKNYDVLIITDVFSPRILVLVTVPADDGEWMSLSSEQLVLRRCAYWASLAGLQPSENEHTVTISVPRANVLTDKVVQELMRQINDGGSL